MEPTTSVACTNNACACDSPAERANTETPRRAGEWTYRPAVDVIESESAYRIVADAPGSSAEAVSVTFEDGVLTVDAPVQPRVGRAVEAHRVEYGVGSFHRRFRVHGDIDAGAISAAYSGGVLTVTLPKSERSRPRRIPVSAG